MEVDQSCDGSSTVNRAETEEEEIVYRLDKDEFSNGMATIRNNLLYMMQKESFLAKKLRKLIVEGVAPLFTSTVPDYEALGADQGALNVDQKQAIAKVMSAKDYALVLGMPGTGKTTTIAHIIRALTAQGKSVLLSSYTHTAVDNILLKFRNENIRVLRIGAPAKIHPEVQQFAYLASAPKKSFEELKEMYESQVVATTCLGVNHPIFNQRVFDYCIVDEASQITLPVCLGPIRMAQTFILVGDHYQLPPLVQNKEAQEGGLDVSLFKLLSDSRPSSVVNLEHQYRMCEEVMFLSNILIYSGRLKCGTSEVASQSLHLPKPEGLLAHHLNGCGDRDSMSKLPSSFNQNICLGSPQARCWVRDMVDPRAKTRFVNTDTLLTPAHETAHGLRIVNHTEVILCTQLVKSFVSCGILPCDIGIITFYRSQLSILKQHLRDLPGLEMHTADKFQGRDKEVVIVSCVRSNPEKNVGELLRDWRRINVAFTRARTKLLVVGSKSTLHDGNDLLRKYIHLVENKGWVYNLPQHATDSHIFEHDGTRLSPQSNHNTRSVNQRQRLQHHGPSSPEVSKLKLLSPGKQATSSGTPKKPLSPLKGSSLNQRELKKPAKKGAKLLSPASDGKSSTTRVLGNRPILQGMMNEFVG